MIKIEAWTITICILLVMLAIPTAGSDSAAIADLRGQRRSTAGHRILYEIRHFCSVFDIAI